MFYSINIRVCLGGVGDEGPDFLGFTLRYERSVLSGSDRYLQVSASRDVAWSFTDRSVDQSNPCHRRDNQPHTVSTNQGPTAKARSHPQMEAHD